MSTAPAVAPMTVRTVRFDAAELLTRLPRRSGLAWVRRGDGIVGWGEAARVEVTGPRRMAAAAAWWRDFCAGLDVRDEVGLPGCGPVAFGSFTFDDLGADSLSVAPVSGARLPGHGGRSVLVVPGVIAGRRGDTGWITTVSGSGRPRPLEPVEPTLAPVDVTFAEGALSAVVWQKVVADAVERIVGGDLDKVVLARDLVATAAEALDYRWIVSRLASDYPSCWAYAVDGLVGATPELYVRRQHGLVTSRVLAGTIRRTGDDQRDLALAASLARSSKDLEEHEYAVRSVADALAPHCTGMNVPESPFVLHLPNVMHLATDVTGVSATSLSSLDLAGALHPSAAVCGTPTQAALEVIRELEGMDRGRYAGPVGWIDAAGDGEWGIALRCAQIDPDDQRRLRLFAGCGIVAGSDPEAELAEAQAKFVPMRDALS